MLDYINAQLCPITPNFKFKFETLNNGYNLVSENNTYLIIQNIPKLQLNVTRIKIYQQLWVKRKQSWLYSPFSLSPLKYEIAMCLWMFFQVSAFLHSSRWQY